MTDTKPQTQEAQRAPNREMPSACPEHVAFELQNTEDGEGGGRECTHLERNKNKNSSRLPLINHMNKEKMVGDI